MSDNSIVPPQQLDFLILWVQVKARSMIKVANPTINAIVAGSIYIYDTKNFIHTELNVCAVSRC